MRNGFLGLLLAVVGCSSVQPATDRAPAEQGELLVRHPAAPPPETSQDITQFRTGRYTLDRRHTSIIWRVRHYGLSMFIARFDRKDGALSLDAANPENSQVSITIDAASVSTGILNRNGQPAFDGEIAAMLGASEHPQITFTSESVVRTGPNRGVVHGALSLNGVTLPVALEAQFVGGDVKEDRGATDLTGLAFSGRTTIRRSDFNVAPDWNDFVGDDVEILIDAEFWGERES